MTPRRGQFRATWLALACLAVATVWTSFGTAEEVDKPSPSNPPASAKPLPLEEQPPIYYLPDKDGKLQPVLGFSFEQFTELFKLKNQLEQQNQRPPFAIENLALSGAADSRRAELVAQFQITVHESGWVGVPLRLNDAVLIELLGYEGGGEHFLHFDPARHGYVIWIRGEAGKSHQVKLKLLAPLSHIGPESHLRLSVPRAALSQFNLELPMERAVVHVADGGTLESAKPAPGGKTAVKVVGVGGELDISWHMANSQVANLPAVLEVTGAVQVRINGRNVSSDAKLTVRSLGGEFDRFQVRLPPGADYAGTPQPGISLVAAEKADGDRKLYEVKLEKKTNGPIDVRLVTERVHSSPQGEEPLELAGFEVPGAVRQWGTVTVQVEGNWQLRWGELNHVQIDELSGPLRSDHRSAGFEYFVQPFSLPARVVPQTTRVRVEPEYVFFVGGDEAQLRAKLKFMIRGAKLRTLEIDMPGWELDAVEPENLTELDSASTSQTRPFVIPLAQPTSGELELTIQAHQKIAHDAPSMVLELPVPRAETVAPALVAIVPADNIELVVQPDKTTGLAPQAPQRQMKLPERQQDPLFFRTEGPAAKFVGAVKVYEQSITASSTAQLDVEESQTSVDERITFKVAYQPIDHLTLGIPATLRVDRLNLMLDGERLSPIAPRDRAEGDAELSIVRVPLPGPRIGRCELEVSYVVRHDKPSGATSAPVTIPLVIPGEGQLNGNEITITPKSGVSVEYPKGDWTDDSAEHPATSGELSLSARRALAKVVLAVRSKEATASGATSITRAFVQSRLTDVGRQDRAVYALSSNDPRLQVTIPAGADTSSLVVEVDGRRVAPESIRQREITVPLANPTRSEHVLELRYHLADRPSTGEIALECPQIKSARWVEQLYWQLCVPSREHVVFASDHFTPEYRWQWSGAFWRRTATLGLSDLERWVGATAETAAASEVQKQAAGLDLSGAATNEYLYSSLGPFEPLEVYTVARARLILWCSLPVLLLGLVLIYFPAARHPALLFILAVVVAGSSLIDPELGVLAGQAAALGLVLCVVAALLARASVAPPVPSTASVHGSSKGHAERGVTEMYHRPPAPALQASTATNPLVPSSGEAES